MSKIRVDVDYPIYDGLNLTFTAPCDCTSADGLRVYYPDGNKTFAFCDAHNRNIYGIGNVFSEGALVKVVLDVKNGKAFIQNADYNTYIDGLIRKYGKVFYGTYVGNGATGEGAISLSFEFEPGLLIVGRDNFSNVGANYIHPVNNFVWLHGQSSIVTQTYYEDSTLSAGKVSKCTRLEFTTTDNAVSWVAYTVQYGEADVTVGKADEHFNTSGTTYYYLAIGKNDIDGSDDEEIESAVIAAANSANEAKMWADGEGAAVDDPQYNNNAKYYSEVAKAAAESLVETESKNDKRISVLESIIIGDLAQEVTDGSVAYRKDVPENALPFAEVSIVGGVTRNCANEFNPSYIKQLDNLTYTNGVFNQIAADTRAVQYFKMQKFKNDGYVGEACSSYAGYVGVLKSSFTIDGTFDTLRIGFGGESMDTIFDMDVTNLANGAYYISINCTNLTQGSVSFTEVMISTKDIPYEPYFEGVRSAQVTEVESMGANLMPLLTEKTQYGITIRRDSDGIYHISGTATENVAEAIPISLPEGTYSLRLNCSKSVGTKSDDTISVVARSFNRWVIARHAFEDDVALTNSCPKIDSILFVVYKGVTCDDVTIAPMLNKGVALPYSPYNKWSLPIPEAVQALEGYGWGISDTCYNYIDLDKKQFVKRVERVVLDGSADEKWAATAGLNKPDYNAFYVRMYAENSHKAAWGAAVGDTLPNRIMSDLYNKNCDGFWTGDKTDKQIIVRVPNTITNATELRTWLSANPLTVYYEAMETTVIDVSDILSNDNYIEVEGGGTLTFKNERGYAVPSEVVFVVKGEMV